MEKEIKFGGNVVLFDKNNKYEPIMDRVDEYILPGRLWKEKSILFTKY